MRALIRLFFVTTLLCLSGCQAVGRDALFRLTLHVVDDEGQPVNGATARIGAERRSQAGESDGKGVFVEGVTDEKGQKKGSGFVICS